MHGQCKLYKFSSQISIAIQSASFLLLNCSIALHHLTCLMPAFSRLIRFLAKDGRTYYGDAILPQGITDIGKTKQARVIKGDIFGKHDVTEQIAVCESLGQFSYTAR